jgi:hypothetical protein
MKDHEKKEDTTTPQGQKIIRITLPRNIQDGKKILARVLKGYADGRIPSQPMRDLVYATSKFIEACKTADVELRVLEIEAMLGREGDSNGR